MSEPEVKKPFPDFNNNGIADYKEPALWRFAGKFVSRIVVAFAPSHTVAYRVARWYLDNVDSLGKV